jgi:photosystem II stability/assembly factor-like uncharacterized protein
VRFAVPVLRLCFVVVALLPFTFIHAQDPKPEADPIAALNLAGLRLRSVGPAVTSGRIVGLAVHPQDRATYYGAVASGGVWKTTNAGTSWTPIFDDQGSYSIGYITLDPKNPSTVWVGTGENNSQRSTSYGDGVYRSDDGGKSWRKVGLEKSEKIGKILLDPRDSSVVYVAAQGPLWGPGGDRGLYKTTDGGKTWAKVLNISQNTGVTDIVLDANNPDVLIAAAYQRRRHVWTLINGGPESGLHKSTDGGKTWRKLSSGLPAGDVGRIGLAIAPSTPNLVYAIIESTEGKGGIFRSADFGETWEKANPFDSQAQYYAHLVVDPKNPDRIYVMSVFIRVSDDGGRNLRSLGERWKHVDNHCMWIDPNNTDYYLVGCDGGIYESFDRAATWKFIANLPVTQFYDVTCDQTVPFYHVYGGTQDNFTLGGPARNRSASGIVNSDWFVTQGGDGFHSRVDPSDPNIVYSESQYGGLIRFDRRTGEAVGIQPQPGKGEMGLRWNWDSPLTISPHSPTRLYFAANKLFRSEDRGDTWKAISGDLTRQIDRNTLPVMGKIWPPDSVAKSVSTSLYGNCVALAESPKQEDLIYVGTDDGLIQVTEDGGKNWRKIEKFPGVPERTYVARLFASQHDAQTVYAAFDNHKMADFAPYILKSTDAGKHWEPIQGNLPANGPVLAIAEDHVDPKLLFVGTEFGLFFSVTGGEKWVRLKSGLPTIAVRDLAIQKPMNDLVVGTFGRGIYILDDYSPLRHLKDLTGPSPLSPTGGDGPGVRGAALQGSSSLTPNPSRPKEERGTVLFPVREAWMYIPARPLGLPGKSFQGEAFYTASNPPFGATFSYYMKDGLKTKRQKRQEAEKKGPQPYPTAEQLRAEAEEEPPAILLTISDARGDVVRTLQGPTSAGMHRVTWDLRDPSVMLPPPRPPDFEAELFGPERGGPLVMPGEYQVSIAQRVEGVTKPLAGPVRFKVTVVGTEGMAAGDRKELAEFHQKLARLQRAVMGTLEAANAVSGRLAEAKRALDHTPGTDAKYKDMVRKLEKENLDILRALRGDSAIRARNENTPVSIVERVGEAAEATRFSLGKPTGTQREQYAIASEELTAELAKLRKVIETDLRELEKALDLAGAPWTPGRLPEWREK